MSELPPVAGNWYRRLDRPQPFQVVACDAATGTIEIEYFDGTVDEWPAAHWYSLEIVSCEQPQDWSGPYDACNADLQADEGESAPGDADDLDRAVQRAELQQQVGQES